MLERHAANPLRHVRAFNVPRGEMMRAIREGETLSIGSAFDALSCLTT
jgi:hypothetical protein